MEENQKFFEDMQTSFVGNLRRIQIAINKIGNKMISDAKIPIMQEQLPVLMSIYTYKSISQQQIANLTCRDKASIQRSIASLLKAELVKITQNDDDKRVNHVSLTKKGLNAANKIKDIIKKLDEQILNHLSATKAEALTKNLRNVVEHLEEN